MQALNYPASAARGLRRYIDELKTKAVNAAEFEADFVACEQLIRLLETAEHFQLPENGDILNDRLKGIKGKGVRLPYQLITASYHISNTIDVDGTDVDGTTVDGSKLEPVPKRVTLAYQREIQAGTPDAELFPGCQRICEVAAIFGRDNGEWVPCISIALFPADQWDGAGYEGELARAPELMTKPTGVAFVGRVKIILPGRYKRLARTYGPQHAERAAYHDIAAEVSAVLEMCEALTCSNVHEATIQHAKPGLNERRIRDGKLPLWETKVLTIDVPVSRTNPTPWQGGTHATPRLHLCQGYIRSWPNDPTRNIWINDYARGDPAKGSIKKTYKLRAAP
jgi:hypothetical protein